MKFEIKEIIQLGSLLFVVVTLSIYCALPSSESALMELAKASFQLKYPDVEDVSWEQDDNGYFEAQFERHGEKYRADFGISGKWIETEASIKFKDLPKAVQEAVERAYDKDDIVEIEEVDHFEKGVFYDVEIDEKGAKKFDVEYNALGRVLVQ